MYISFVTRGCPFTLLGEKVLHEIALNVHMNEAKAPNIHAYTYRSSVLIFAISLSKVEDDYEPRWNCTISSEPLGGS